MKNPCIKTGCMALLASQIWRGDLFDLGDYYFLDCSSGPQYVSPEGMTFNLSAETWYSTHQDEKVVLIRQRDIHWFSYEGCVVDAQGLILAA